ncbi:MAG: putative glycosyltransferase [Verrucomicrobiales bacterium]|nr:putative glycosyltransferase [Verrucomicrobiales bacterium]
MTPAISFIIPTHNRAALLPAAIASARQAALRVPLEIIVVDDASTDDTPQTCAALTGVTTLRLPVNQGLASARNAGIRAASAPLIAFLDDDDARLPGSLDLQAGRLEASPQAALVYAQVECLPNHTLWPPALPEGDLFVPLLQSNFIPVTSVLVRRHALLAAGAFDSRLREIEDWDLWLKIAARHPFVSIPSPVAQYTEATAGSGQLSSNRIRMSLGCARVQNRALNSPRGRQLPQAQRDLLRTRLLRRQWFELTLAALVHLLTKPANLPAFRRHLITAFRLQPRHSLTNPAFRSLAKSLLRPAPAAELKSLRRAVYSDLAEFEDDLKNRPSFSLP